MVQDPYKSWISDLQPIHPALVPLRWSTECCMVSWCVEWYVEAGTDAIVGADSVTGEVGNR